MKSKNLKKNKFDELVENLVQAFIKIPNFDLTQHDETAQKAFNTITFRIMEVTAYKDLVYYQFIPATNKAIHEGKQLILNSKYRSFLDIKGLDFNDTLYETIRLAYVGLFHKIESFINDIIAVVDLVYPVNNSNNQNIAQWIKLHYQIDFKNWQQFYIIHKINWICNCVKHRDGYPLKEPKPAGFNFIDSTQRIKLSPTEFKHDCEILVSFYSAIITILMTFGQARFFLEDQLLSFDNSEYQNSKAKIEEILQSLKVRIASFSDFENSKDPPQF